jgi:hypothetical protein
MNTKGAVIFDIIGTCFSLDKPRQRLVELGAPPHALELWFAQTLRDAFALSHAGSYRQLKEVLEASPVKVREASRSVNVNKRPEFSRIFRKKRKFLKMPTVGDIFFVINSYNCPIPSKFSTLNNPDSL